MQSLDSRFHNILRDISQTLNDRLGHLSREISQAKNCEAALESVMELESQLHFLKGQMLSFENSLKDVTNEASDNKAELTSELQYLNKKVESLYLSSSQSNNHNHTNARDSVLQVASKLEGLRERIISLETATEVKRKLEQHEVEIIKLGEKIFTWRPNLCAPRGRVLINVAAGKIKTRCKFLQAKNTLSESQDWGKPYPSSGTSSDLSGNTSIKATGTREMLRLVIDNSQKRVRTINKFVKYQTV